MPLSESEITRWVAPFYMRLLHGNFRHGCLAPSPDDSYLEFKQSFKAAICSVSPAIVKALLEERNWRMRLVGGWFAGLNGLIECRDVIGQLLLQSSVCYAGQGYAVALACFADDVSVRYLCKYLEDYLPQTANFYDQHWAMPALTWIDTRTGSNHAAEFLRPNGLWSNWEKSTNSNLEQFQLVFNNSLSCAREIIS